MGSVHILDGPGAPWTLRGGRTPESAMIGGGSPMMELLGIWERYSATTCS